MARKKKPEKYYTPEELDIRTRLLTGYSAAVQADINAGRKPITKGRYMMLVYGDRWHGNEANARRTFNKITTKETSGKRFVQAGRYVGPGGVGTTYHRNENGVLEPTTNAPIVRRNLRAKYKRGQPQRGYWKVNVTFLYRDKNGYIVSDETAPEKAPVTRSFTLFSYQYISETDVAFIQNQIGEIIEYKIFEWSESNTEYSGKGVPNGWDSIDIEVFPVGRTDMFSNEGAGLDSGGVINFDDYESELMYEVDYE